MLYRSIQALILGSIVAVTYGLGVRLAFGPRKDFLELASLGTAVLISVGLGILAVTLAPRRTRNSWRYGLLLPWLPYLILGIVIAILR